MADETSHALDGAASDASDAASPVETLYLIDGHAQIFRAYFAIRTPMSSPVTGEPTNACFAFTGMMLKLFSSFRPDYTAMAIDLPGKTFRDELYDQYKATRPPAPEDLIKQEKRIFSITELFGVPVIGQPGAEADDIIATIVQRILGDPALSHLHIRIVSRDKDLEQLIGPRVTMFDIHKDELVDEAKLWETKGVRPDQVRDVLALSGDNVDNIPGVEGVGPKTAAKLINQYGSVQNLLDHLDEIKGKRKENIAKAAGHLPLSLQLVTLKDDLDLPLDLAAMSTRPASVGEPDATAKGEAAPVAAAKGASGGEASRDPRLSRIDAPQLRRVFKELGFNRHVRDLNDLVGEPTGGEGGGESAADGASQPGGRSPRRSQPADPNQGSLFGGPSEADAAEPASQTADAGSDFKRADPSAYRAICSQSELDDLVKLLREQPIIAVDTETIGLGHRAEVCGICLAWDVGSGVYVPMRSPTPAEHLPPDAVLQMLGPLLEDASVKKVGHNIKYDWLVLRHAGVRMRGVAFDTMVAAHLAGATSLGMDALSMRLLGRENVSIKELIGEKGRGKKQKTMDQVPLDQITTYAAEDADVTLQLRDLLAKQIHDWEMDELSDAVEMPLVEVLAVMEHHGVRVDPEVLKQQQDKLARRIEQLRDSVREKANALADCGEFNLDSPKQLGVALFEKLGMPVIKKTKSGPSTDVSVLERLAQREDVEPDKQQIAKLMIEYRQLTKLVGTYLEALREAIDPTTGRVHATFHQTGAATGRLSSSGPNLQNIPIRTDIGRQIRKAFIADPGHVLISADYSQIELRVLAHLSEDAALLDAFAKGLDIHAAVAAQVFGVEPDAVTPQQRTQAKTINFGIVYGVTAFGLAQRIEGLSLDEAKHFISDYKKRFPGIDQFLQDCVSHAANNGYVATILGRRRAIPEITSRNPNTRALGERLAINTVVQGSAADLIKTAMVRLHRRIEAEALPMRLLLQIHDELVVETPREHAEAMGAVVAQEMEGAMSLKVPVKVDLAWGEDWFGAK